MKIGASAATLRQHTRTPHAHSSRLQPLLFRKKQYLETLHVVRHRRANFQNVPTSWFSNCTNFLIFKLYLLHDFQIVPTSWFSMVCYAHLNRCNIFECVSTKKYCHRCMCAYDTLCTFSLFSKSLKNWPKITVQIHKKVHKMYLLPDLHVLYLLRDFWFYKLIGFI